MVFFQNTGTVNNPAFAAAISHPFGLNGVQVILRILLLSILTVITIWMPLLVIMKVKFSDVGGIL
jgi:hypothetical protein